MAPSQLKRLKASLREQGVAGPTKSKKQKQSQARSKTATSASDRQAALQNIRDAFNPFEFKPAKPAKFESVSHKTANAARNGAGGKYKEVLHRPGVTKSAGEEMRRRQLLPELQRRNKVGGVVDKRIGEGDATMTAEERAVQRFAARKKGGASLFDLEASDDEEMGAGLLTHGGRGLEDLAADDFGEQVSGSEDGSEGDDEFMKRKRPRDDDEEEEEAEQLEEAGPERKKTKKEVMEEVIAKSKLHKYERQKVKEDDDDLREQLDNSTADMLALLRGHKPVQPKQDADKSKDDSNTSNGPTMNPDRQKLLDGMDRSKADKEYEVRMRQLAQDTRAKPSDRSKTVEEKAKEDADRLKAMEDKRTRRMRGEEVSDDESGGEEPAAVEAEDDDDVPDEAADFGFTNSNAATKPEDQKVVHLDEDEFDYDEDLVASDTDAELSEESDDSEDSDADADVDGMGEEDDDADFTKDFAGGSNATPLGSAPASGLPYTYPCPQTHEDFVTLLESVALDQTPTVIQRIRAVHHPSLSAANKEAMARFSRVLVDHIGHLGDLQSDGESRLPVIEQVMRHVHSLSRSYPLEISDAFRTRLQTMAEREGAVKLTGGDLTTLTAIGSIYPTSDHFHPVVTPAITLMARWLGLTEPSSPAERTTGACLVALCIRYQKLSRRYVPEAIRFALHILTTKKSPPSKEESSPHVTNLLAMADLWQDTSAFTEIFDSFPPLLKHLGFTKEAQRLSILLQQSRLRRRPLELHHHKRLAIRSSVPKFEEGFNPDRHYDPDKERSDAKKLQKEYKREHKGALRELRKDSNFIAREMLREKKERDVEYERKQRRLIAEIQGEEGRESKEYAREKERRKRSKARQ